MKHCRYFSAFVIYEVKTKTAYRIGSVEGSKRLWQGILQWLSSYLIELNHIGNGAHLDNVNIFIDRIECLKQVLERDELLRRVEDNFGRKPWILLRSGTTFDWWCYSLVIGYEILGHNCRNFKVASCAENLASPPVDVLVADSNLPEGRERATLCIGLLNFLFINFHFAFYAWDCHHYRRRYCRHGDSGKGLLH